MNLATELYEAVQASDQASTKADAYDRLRASVLAIADTLATVEPSYGHAARLHKLTGG